MGDVEKGVIAGDSTPDEREKLAFLLKVKQALFCATEDPDLDMAMALSESLKKQGLLIVQGGVDFAKTPSQTFLNVQFQKSDLLQALDLIGPAVDEETFQARFDVAFLIGRRVCREYENRFLRMDPVTKKADVREIDNALASALAGTEFTARALQPDREPNLVVDLNPKHYNHPMAACIYAHDCDQCTPLGTYDSGGTTYDLYFCGKGIHTVIARYGNAGGQYLSGIGMQSAPLVEAQRRAKERGLL